MSEIDRLTWLREQAEAFGEEAAEGMREGYPLYARDQAQEAARYGLTALELKALRVEATRVAHPLMTYAWEREWKRLKQETPTREDWEDFRSTITAYRLRFVARHRGGV